MRQHVNPLSKNFHDLEPIPPLNEIFENPNLPLHLDIGCAAGDFLFDLALENKNWNYLGIEIREKLVISAKLRINKQSINNLYFSFANANNIFDHSGHKFLIDQISSISFNFPDPWFKKKHHKRRVIQTELINLLSTSLQKGALIYIKTDVKELFEYMDLKISDNKKFKTLSNAEHYISKSFNPHKIQTSREKYVLLQKLHIFERIYVNI